MEAKRRIWYRDVTATEALCHCGQWKNHWLQHAQREWPHLCCVKSCVDPAEQAIVLQPVKLFARKERYVVPVCAECSIRHRRFFDWEPNTVLVPLNPQLPCQAYDEAQAESRVKIA